MSFCIDCGSDLTYHKKWCRFYSLSSMGKRLSDDPGLAEMKRMEYLMSKAPCIARLNDLAAYSAKDEEEEHSRSCAEMKEFLNRAYE